MKKENPVIWSDYPDPDIIRVEDTYYMISTTMHMMPGGVVLRSYDLLHWEIASYVFAALDHTPGQRLCDGIGIYGKGMWAASLKYHDGIFYVCFVANDTGKTYLYTAKEVSGPWEKHQIEGFYHDCSLFFEDDGSVYLMYGNRDIYLTELAEDLSGPKEGGLHRRVLSDTDDYGLGFEGSHLYKIQGRYYAFFIHWPKGGNGRRQQACYVADSLTGEFKGGNVLDDAMEYQNAGVAQGGIVDSPDGTWYAMLFQDRGAVGRVPVLVPVCFEQGFPVFGVQGKVPLMMETKSERPEYVYTHLYADDDFTGETLNAVWQWNHEPDDSLWSLAERSGYFRRRTNDICNNIIQAKNTLTQRTFGPCCTAEITVDAGNIREGDYAGIGVLQSKYGFLAVTKRAGEYALVLQKCGKNQEEKGEWSHYSDCMEPVECEIMKIQSESVELKIICDFRDGKDVAYFYRKSDGQWKEFGEPLSMVYSLEHFMGYRFAITYFSTKETGGTADFTNFKLQIVERPEDAMDKGE